MSKPQSSPVFLPENAATNRRQTLGQFAAYTLGPLVLVIAIICGINLGSADRNTLAGPSTDAPASAMTSSVPPPSTTLGRAEGNGKILRLADHPLLQDSAIGIAKTSCSLPQWKSNPAAAEQFFTAATECLNTAWEPILRQYKLPFTPPSLNFPTGSRFSTDCGTMTVNLGTAAYYCENNLYLPFKGLQTDQYGNDPGVYLALIAHEYGHHVQELSGLLDAAWAEIEAAEYNNPLGREMSRRKELQAQCFSGMFLTAFASSGDNSARQMYASAWKDQSNRGDDTSAGHEHGINAHYAGWWRTGAETNRLFACNTFSAPSADVS